MNQDRPASRRWVGVLLSFLIPGAGIYLARDRAAGLRWFFGLVALAFVTEAMASLPAIPGVTVVLIGYCSELVLVIWMLVVSYRPVPKLALRGWLLLLSLTGALVAAVWMLPLQFTRPFLHPTACMRPTLLPGDKLFAQTSAYWLARPRRGDVIVFKTDAVESLPKGQFFIKRIAALPGEKVQIRERRLLIDGSRMTEPEPLTSEDFTPPLGGFFPHATNFLIVPVDSYFVVGDNATNSRDSRDFGPIPSQSIIGKATKIYWPPSRIGDIQ